MQKRTYDIVNAGPRNRFCVNGRIVHNSGRGPQPQNLPGGGPDVKLCSEINGCGHRYGAHLTACPWCGAPDWAADKVEWSVDAVETALRVIATGRLEQVEHYFGDAVGVVSGCLRALFSAPPGRDLICSDYSAIEAVVLAALAGEEWRLDVFRTHGHIYEESVARITGLSVQEMLDHKERAGEKHPLRNKLGKPAELGSGFGGSVGAWKNFGAAEYFDSDDEIKRNVDAWREASPNIVNFWHGLERAAKDAVRNPGQCFAYRGITYGVKNDVLYCQLWSGRKLCYHQPRLLPDVTPWGSETTRLTYMGWNSDYKKGPKGWMRLETYGGKLAENCIAEGTEVLTDRGWVEVQNVTADCRVWDGVEWVEHSGMAVKGVQDTIEVGGARMTADHYVLADGGWKRASQITGFEALSCRLPDRDQIRGFRREEKPLALRLRLRADERAASDRTHKNEKARHRGFVWLHEKTEHIAAKNWARYGSAPRLRRLAFDAGAVPEPLARRLCELRRPRDNRLPAMAGILPEFLVRLRRRLGARPFVGPDRQQPRIRTVKRSLGGIQNAVTEQANESAHKYAMGRNGRFGSVGEKRDRCDHAAVPAGPRRHAGTPVRQAGRYEQVYDLVNCGPRKRFVVRGKTGAPLIVHNCTQATARDILTHAMPKAEAAGYAIVLHVHDEIVTQVPEGTGSVEELEAIMADLPDWCRDWPISAAGGWRGKRYRKD